MDTCPAKSSQHLSKIQVQNSCVLCVIMCALVQSWTRRQCFRQDYMMLKCCCTIKKRNLPNYSWVPISRGLNQYALPNNLEQFVAEGAERYPTCEDHHSQERPRASNEPKGRTTHRHGRPCAYLTKEPEPSDRRKHIIIEMATIPVNAAPPNRGTISHSNKIMATNPECSETIAI